MKMEEMEKIEKKMFRLSKFLSRKMLMTKSRNGSEDVIIIRIRDLPALIQPKEDFKRILQARIEPAKRVKKRFQDNLRMIKKLKEEVVKEIPSQAVVEELKSRNRLLISELTVASEIEKIAPILRRMLKLLVKEESSKGTLKEVREEFQEI